ncbi:MAG: 4-hydroxy-tetrahydrodipicolinate reductase [Thermoproteota archaeon]|jgi:4-hydroxy-tetrahydrodipicolinate reductase|nr:4-hydroxy-tetrahydrodipicolinate reductase [Thermoproteota archaeon]
MNIAIIGYGKMGRAIHEVAKENKINVVSIIDPTDPEATHREITHEALKNVDVALDFSRADAVVSNVEKLAKLKRNIVMGTTGWYDKINIVKKIVEENEIGFIYSPNFSIGVNLFFAMINKAAELFNKAKWYDVYVYEIHHNKKIDSPSGTALQIANILLSKIERKKKILAEVINRRIEPEELHVASIRAGHVFGLHVVGFDSEFDNIELKHEAKNRKGFALGALLAAKWIINKKGFYNFIDVFSELI